LFGRQLAAKIVTYRLVRSAISELKPRKVARKNLALYQNKLAEADRIKP